MRFGSDKPQAKPKHAVLTHLNVKRIDLNIFTVNTQLITDKRIISANYLRFFKKIQNN